jgi:hypothetical protein
MRFSLPARRKIPSTSVAISGQDVHGRAMCMEWSRTLLFEEDAAFCDYNGYIAVDVALAFIVEQRDRDVGVTDGGV